MELRAGDRVRCTRNDPASGLVNGQVAEVDSIERDSVRFRLEDGSALRLSTDDPQLRYMDRAWASTAHAFQGRTVDNVIRRDGGKPPASDDAAHLLCRHQQGA